MPQAPRLVYPRFLLLEFWMRVLASNETNIVFRANNA
jgi:hypothetical protein